MRRRVAALAAVALLAAVGARADPLVDQASDPDVADSAGCGNSPLPLFQGFTPSRRQLAAVAVRLRAARPLPDGYSFVLRVRHDWPAGEIVGSVTATMPGPIEQGRSALARGSFDPPLVLEPEGTYVIEGPIDTTLSVSWDVSTSDVYPGGTGYNCAGQAVPSFDFSFITYTPTDGASPETAITNAPAPGSLARARVARIAFSGTDDLSYASRLTFTCVVDRAAPVACTSPLMLRGLADGRHAVTVGARDETGRVDPSPASVSWIVDATPPGAVAVRGPRRTLLARPVYSFSADGAAGFRCSLDRQKLVACGRTFRPRLSIGAHVVNVAAVDRAKNVGPLATVPVRRIPAR